MRPSELATRPIEALIPYASNSRTHSDAQVAQIAASITEFGFTNPVLIDGEGGIIAGHGRVLAAKSLGLEAVPVLVIDHLTEAQRRAYVIADNKLALNAGWDEAALRSEISALADAEFDLSLLGFDDDDLGDLLSNEDLSTPASSDAGAEAGPSLADRFGIAPFSVLNAREGWWQDRKRAWLALGIRSEVGRGENLPQMSETMLEPDPAKRAALKGKARTFGQDLMRGEHVVGSSVAPGLTWVGGARGNADAKTNGGVLMPSHTAGDPQFYAKKRRKEAALGRELTTDEFLRDHYEADASAIASGTSIFDPVLCELAYRWWSPPGGLVLDPFAGGSVRGIVAAKTGRSYVGVDLRQEQVDANRAQANEICADGIRPEWICADSRTLDALDVGAADMLFSCPPYADLEVYSDDPQDLSTLEYEDFRAAYGEIIAKACARLKPDRFACFVVGDVRDRKGAYRNFVGDTVEAFRAAGLAYYNEAILVTACGSLALRAGKQFTATRKLGKTHQNVLVFLKGDAKRATAACGVPEFAEMTEDPEGGAGL